jgi:shikimate kinase
MRRRERCNVFLIGFMAAGKTRLGRVLARRLGRPFVDSDAEIERSRTRSIAAIFADEGETRFRRHETRVVARIARTGGQVVAVGGGAVVDPANVAAMRRGGVVVYLETPFSVLFERAERQARALRPIWCGATRLERRRAMARLYAARRGAYRLAADVVVGTKGRPIRAVADEALRRLVRDGWVKP